MSVSLTESREGYIHPQASILDGSAGFKIYEENRRLRLLLYDCPRRDRSTWGDGDKVLIEECCADFAAHLVYTIALDCKDETAESLS